MKDNQRMTPTDLWVLEDLEEVRVEGLHTLVLAGHQVLLDGAQIDRVRDTLVVVRISEEGRGENVLSYRTWSVNL